MKSYQTAVGYFSQVKDWLGTPHITLDPAGTVKNAVDYYPYGKSMPGRSSYGTNYEGYRYKFTGHERDGETGYQYHGARYYDEDLARYMSVDPLAIQFHAWSSYNYVMGNPNRFIDPTGKGPTDWVSINGQMIYDSKVTDQKTATERYGSDAVYRAPGYDYTSDNGNYTVLGENGQFTSNGESKEAVDFADQNSTDLAWNTSSSVGLKGSPDKWLSTVNLDFFGDGLTTTNPVERYFDPAWRTPEMIAMYKGTDNLANLFANTMTAIVLAPLALEGGIVMYGQLMGEYGVTAQVAAWYRVGNTAADATSQAIDISANGGNWDWGSTAGNLSFNNPFMAAAPSFAYKTALNPQEWKSNLVDYGLNVSGNIIGDRIKTNTFLSQGMTRGIAGYTFPLLWNIGSN